MSPMLPSAATCAWSPQVSTCFIASIGSLARNRSQRVTVSGPSFCSTSSCVFTVARTHRSGSKASGYFTDQERRNRAARGRIRERGNTISKLGETETKEANPTTAEGAVERGLVLFKKGRVKDALSLFDSAMDMKPTPAAAQAALYNKACCHVAQGEGKEAALALQLALSRYDLQFSVILSDPDMAAFRATPEFRDLREAARKGGDETGGSFRRDLKLMNEVRSPFRGVRKFFYVALTAAASISTLFTVPLLITAVRGGGDAPPLSEPLQNLAINLAGIVVFVGLYVWDNGKEEEQLSRLVRDETLSRLPLRLQTGRVVQLAQLRDNTRPVIIVGGKESVARAMRAAERFRSDIEERGVLLVPLVWSASAAAAANVDPAKKRGFGNVAKAPTVPLPASEDGFDEKVKAAAAKGVTESERKFRAEIVSPGEWEMWVKEQQEVTGGATPGEDVYIVLRLDGRVRKSGKGAPNWGTLVDEIPKLDALVSKLER